MISATSEIHRRHVHSLRRGHARFSVASLAGVLALTSAVRAEDTFSGQRPARREGLSSDTHARPSPFSVFDADRDGVLSTAEINAASAVLRRFDRNGDGRLSGDEMTPRPPRRHEDETDGAPGDDRLPPPPAHDAP